MMERLWFLLLSAVILSGCLGGAPGSDRDENGCIGSAGYTWCEAKQKCLRAFEETCEAGGTATTVVSADTIPSTTVRRPLGGDVDEHGCKPSTGYTWCDIKGKCIRSWEENCTGPDVKKYVSTDLGICAKIDYGCGDGEPFTDEIGCGCRTATKVQQGVKACTEEARVCPDGTAVSRDPKNNCEFKPCLGEVKPGGTAEENHNCTKQQRSPPACTMEYRPVCGWYNEQIRCLRYPCGQTYGNPCTACADEKVAYWTDGGCPTDTKPIDGGDTQIANPASAYCKDKLGGQLTIKESPAGQTGYCRLPDGRNCEEWALFRSDGTDCKGLDQAPLQ